MTNNQVIENDFSLKKICSNLPVEPLLQAIEKNPGLWGLNTWRQDEAGGQQDTNAIMLRWADGNNFARVRDSISVVNTNVFDVLPESISLLNEALKLIEATEWGRTFIVRLKPGGRVYPHSDVGMYADKFERFHICLQADPEFEYSTQHPTGPVQSCNMMPGDLWWFNHKRTHWAYNGGDRDRISIVLDAVSPKWKRKRDVLYIGVGYKKEEVTA